MAIFELEKDLDEEKRRILAVALITDYQILNFKMGNKKMMSLCKSIAIASQKHCY